MKFRLCKRDRLSETNWGKFDIERCDVYVKMGKVL